MRIDLIKQTFFNEEETKEKLCQFIREAKKLSMGEQCLLAEQEFAALSERTYAVLFNSGSSANLALVQAYLNLGLLQKGDRVGFSSLTWSTNVMPLLQLGLVPVPIDVHLDTLNVHSEQLVETYKKYGVRAFFGTNVLGFAGDVDQISKVSKELNILYFEDNCESLGTRLGGKLLGNFGHAGTYSFYVGHHFSTIEGGAVCTDDEELYRMLIMVRAHGWDRNLNSEDQQMTRKKYNVTSDFYAKYIFYDLGYNFRPNEITGFLLRQNIQFAPQIIAQRQKNFFSISSAIKEALGDRVYPLNISHLDTVSNFAIPVICKEKNLFDRLTKKFQDNDIEMRPVVAGNIFLQPFFKKYVQEDYYPTDFPHITTIHENGFYFGNNPDLTEEEICFIKETFQSLGSNY